MSSQEDTTPSTNANDRLTRPINRRDYIYEKRQNILQHRQTDTLPKINGDTTGTKGAQKTLTHLREENKRMRLELEDLQQLVSQYQAAQTRFDREFEAIHNSHQQELEQYQDHLREMMEERNQMQEMYQHLERRYQELYHSFQDAVEEEANNMVSEAARTLVLSPEHTPVLLHDVVKTLENQFKQVEDQHIAEALYLLRETQHKAEQLEQELESERRQVEIERQNLLNMQNSVRTQAQLRYKVLRDHLQSRWTLALTFMTTALLLVLPVLQIICYYSLKLPLSVSLFAPILICMVLAFYLARIRSSLTRSHASAAHKAKTPAAAGK